MDLKYTLINGKTVDESDLIFITNNKRSTYSKTTIGTTDFMGKIVIPDSVTTINDEAFVNNYLVTSIVIPDSVTSIGDNAFNGCTNLTNVKIGKGITSIGDGAFDGCTSLTSIEINAPVTPTIGTDTFGSSAITIYVPSVAAYETNEDWYDITDANSGNITLAQIEN